MKIIKANETHIPEILEIYVKARKFMKENGNPTQWEEGYPSREIVEKDIAADHCYVCIENENVVGVFVFIIGEDPTYRVIYQGAWRSEKDMERFIESLLMALQKDLREGALIFAEKSAVI